jgi:hypothetical protein
MVAEVVSALVGLLGGYVVGEVRARNQARRDLVELFMLKSTSIIDNLRPDRFDKAGWFLGELRPYMGLVELRLPHARTEAQALIDTLDETIRNRSSETSAVKSRQEAFAQAAG